MADIIAKLRIKYTVYTTLVAGIILAALLGGVFGLLCASADYAAAKSLDAALSTDLMRPDDVGSSRCFCFTLKGNVATYNPIYNNDANYYGDSLKEIVSEAVATGTGRFSVDGKYFEVDTKLNDAGENVYAVYDRTRDRETTLSASMIFVVVYILSLLVIALLAFIFSAKTTEPVKDALEKQRDLVANASHELKTPLTVIATNLTVLKSEPASTIAENGKWIKSIDGQIERMDGLIKNMLELSKLEQSVIPKQCLNFSEIVEGACLEFEAVCFEKNVRLITDIEKDVYVMGERNALERLIIILLDNAIKYCGENGKVGCKLTADSKIRLSVMNTGESISAEDAKHVFDRFYRSDGARKNPDGNSFGLGLSIAQATVAAHGGVISCKGVNGKGSVFNVTLPLPKKKQILAVTPPMQDDTSMSIEVVDAQNELPPPREEITDGASIRESEEAPQTEDTQSIDGNTSSVENAADVENALNEEN